MATSGKPDIRWDKKSNRDEMQRYLAMGGVLFLTCALIIIFYFCVKRYDGLKAGWDGFVRVLAPFLVGAVMAFVMDPTMRWIERHLLNRLLPKAKNKRKTRHRIRLFAASIAIIILLGIIVLFLSFVIPQVVSNLTYIYNHLEKQLVGVIDWANQISGYRFDDTMQEARKPENIHNFLQKFTDFVQNYLNWNKQSQMISDLTAVGMNVGRGIVAFLIGIVASIYILTDKEKFKCQIKQIIFGVFKPKTSKVVMEVLRKALDIFYGFIVGKIIDSAIIGVICYVCMLIFQMPYPVLVSVIVGVTNVIPIFGPYIGAVPTVTMIFFMNPMKGIYFLIFIIVLQQIDGNIIGPKILGDSTGISSFWVLFSIVVGGGLFGFFGMLIGVPTMALIYYICKRLFGHLAVQRGLPRDTRAYINVDHVEDTGLILHTPEAEEKKEETDKEEDKEEDKED